MESAMVSMSYAVCSLFTFALVCMFVDSARKECIERRKRKRLRIQALRQLQTEGISLTWPREQRTTLIGNTDAWRMNDGSYQWMFGGSR